MDIHEYQAKKILKNFGIAVPRGTVVLNINEIEKKIQDLPYHKFILKAQIHSGGRGKAGGIKLIDNKKELLEESKKMMGKILITHQTGKIGKKVQRLYFEEACEIKKAVLSIKKINKNYSYLFEFFKFFLYKPVQTLKVILFLIYKWLIQSLIYYIYMSKKI